MRLSNKSTALIILFLTILLSITTTTFSQKKKQHHKKRQKVETKKIDTVVIQKTNIETTQCVKIDSVKDEIIKTKNEIQKQLEILLALNNSNFDSLNHVFAKRDTAFSLKLDTLVDQTKPEGFWKGFFKNSAYTWLYDTITNLFSSNKGKSNSLFLRLLTVSAIIARFFLLYHRLKEYCGNNNNNKPNKWRIIFSLLSWLILVYSFTSYSQNKEEQYLESIDHKLKQIEKKANQQINSVAYTDNRFNTLLEEIDKKTSLPEQQLAEYKEIGQQLRIQNEIFQKSQKEIKTDISDLKTRQTDAEKNIIDNVKDYSTHGFWILFIIVIIIFSKDIRDLIQKILDSLKGN